MAQLEASKLQIWKIAAVRSVFEQTPHVACFLPCFAHMFFFRGTSFPSICIPLHGLSQQIAFHHAELWTEARSWSSGAYEAKGGPGHSTFDPREGCTRSWHGSWAALPEWFFASESIPKSSYETPSTLSLQACWNRDWRHNLKTNESGKKWWELKMNEDEWKLCSEECRFEGTWFYVSLRLISIWKKPQKPFFISRQERCCPAAAEDARTFRCRSESHRRGTSTAVTWWDRKHRKQPVQKFSWPMYTASVLGFHYIQYVFGCVRQPWNLQRWHESAMDCGNLQGPILKYQQKKQCKAVWCLECCLFLFFYVHVAHLCARWCMNF